MSRPFHTDDLLRVQTLADAQISPDGARVAYTQTWLDGDMDEARSAIWVVPTDGGEPRRWTYGRKRDSSPRWSPDGKWLAFLRDAPGAKAQLYVMPTQGGEPWRLTDLKNGVGEPSWSPDSRQLAFSSQVGEEHDRKAPRVVEHLIHKQDGVGFYDGRRKRVFTVDLEGGEPRQVTQAEADDADWNDLLPTWSPDGREIAFLSYREADRHEVILWHNDVWAVSSEGGEARRLTRGLGPATFPAWSPTGEWIAYGGHERGNRNYDHVDALNAVSPTGGEPRVLTPQLDRGVGGLAGAPIAWAPDGRSAYAVVADRGKYTLVRAGLDGEVRLVLGGDRSIGGVSVARDGRIAYVAMDPSSPGEVYVCDAGGRDERRLTSVNRELLAEVDLGRVERFTYRSDDGWDLEGWALLPPRHDGRPAPAILEIHGGPHGMYGNWFQPVFQALAGAGYVVLYLNPRGSSGYGEEFCGACAEDWGGGDYRDLMGGVDEALSRGWADPARLGVGGYSYGGYMTSWIVGHTDRFKAAVVGAPVSDLHSFWGTSDIGPYWQSALGARLPTADASRFLAHSPLQHLEDCRTPVLLQHNEGDLRCPIGQSDEMFALLKKLEREVVMVRYPGGSHATGQHRPSQRIDYLRRQLDWYDRWLKGASETA